MTPTRREPWVPPPAPMPSAGQRRSAREPLWPVAFLVVAALSGTAVLALRCLT